ncbi:acetate kinase [Singulisphaera sp. GP187]|uniref:acetate/propionate family kinase n=1 Tax=Singulisphaera sp. GP187 TaxID=1882752 RepID=UPI00092656E1|nr:acetate/propionate family kinase [Singulisphaera sp. GP187]SIO64752.1 acetate kinase [Singulisphaera sp. GP187]
MKILVANLGSTSFKYRLYHLEGENEQMLARGAIERIGSTNSKVTYQSPRGESESVEPIANHGDAVQCCLDQLVDPHMGVLEQAGDVAAIGFKAVHARNLTGVQRVNEDVLVAMEAFADVAPAHNPPYTKAMRMLAERFPNLPLVAAFETGFHRTIPEANQRYAIPEEWSTKFGVRRWGFHGASHRYIAGRMAELLGRSDLKLISCHLGGSSSLCAIRDGKSVACSLGMSPQSGLPQNNRVGDFDLFALPVLLRETGKSLDEILDILANQSGLEGLSGAGRDLRDIEAAAKGGDAKAELSLGVYIAAVRQYLGAYLVELGGADAIVFTGGIGENSVTIRSGVCRDLDWLGVSFDPVANAGGVPERKVSAAGSRIEIWTVPTNEEIVVARQTRELLASSS